MINIFNLKQFTNVYDESMLSDHKSSILGGKLPNGLCYEMAKSFMVTFSWHNYLPFRLIINLLERLKCS